MAGRTFEQLSSATWLYQEALRAGVSNGCFETSMQALGADIHLHDILDNRSHKSSGIFEQLARHQLEVPWMLEATPQFIAATWAHILAGNSPDHMILPTTNKQLKGFLWLELYADPAKHPHHASVILPRHDLPRNTRRALQQNNSYLMIDTNRGGPQAVTAQKITAYARDVFKKNGQLGIGPVLQMTR